MTADYLRDILFDFINESDELDVQDVQWDSVTQVLRLTTEDGSKFTLRIESE